jgi:hypothetical protein
MSELLKLKENLLTWWAKYQCIDEVYLIHNSDGNIVLVQTFPGSANAENDFVRYFCDVDKAQIFSNKSEKIVFKRNGMVLRSGIYE